MADRAEVRAGLFVVLALAILAAGTLWIVGWSPFGGRRAEYEVLMKTSSGIRGGDRVRVSGIEVGRIHSVDLHTGDPWPVRFRVSLGEGIALHEGSSARITADGLLGAPYLEIVPGPPDGPRLPPGARIVGAEVGGLMETLEGLGAAGERLSALLESTTEVVTKIDREIEPLVARFHALLSAENVEAVSAGLAGLPPLVEEVRPRLLELVSRVDALASDLERGAEGIPDLTADVSALARDLRDAVGPGGERLAGVLDSADGTLGTAKGALSTVAGNSAELDAMLRDLRATAANLRSLSQTLKERPSLLVRFPRPEDRKPGEGVEP